MRYTNKKRNNNLRSALSHVTTIEASNIQWLLNHPSEVLSGSTILPGTNSPIDIKDVFVDAYKKGFKIIFLVGAGLSALAFVFAFTLLPQIELSRPDEEKLKEEGRKTDAQLAKEDEAKEAVKVDAKGV